MAQQENSSPDLLTAAEREQYASYINPHPIAAHERERIQARADAFPRLLSAYICVDSSLAEAQGEFEELSRALEAATSRATKAESRAEGAEAQAKENMALAGRLGEQLMERDFELAKSTRRAEGLQAELAEQEVQVLGLVKELRTQADALILARNALADCYDVTEWPANGTSSQDAALRAVEACFKLEQLAPTPPPSSPAAAGPGEAGWFSPLVFDSAAEYEASVADVCRRIESGEITPRQVELNSLHRCPLCDESPCGMCPEHAGRLAPTTTGEGKEGVQS